MVIDLTLESDSDGKDGRPFESQSGSGGSGPEPEGDLSQKKWSAKNWSAWTEIFGPPGPFSSI